VASRSVHPFRMFYEAAFDFPYYAGSPELSYFLAAIPRAGSTHLAMQLWKTGLLGAPLEYLNLRDRRPLEDNAAESLQAYWADILRKRTSPNGVFGCKLFTHDIWAVFEQDPGALQLIRADRVIQLRRRNRVQQAISYSRARLSQVWIAAYAGEKKNVEYDFDYIVDSLKSIREQELSWEKILTLTQATSMTVYYEDFSADPEETVQRISAFLGVLGTGPTLVDLPQLSKQRDQTSSDWQDRFERELAERGMTVDGLLVRPTAAEVKTRAAELELR
jgi:trehalose 2-sulfotransferase